VDPLASGPPGVQDSERRGNRATRARTPVRSERETVEVAMATEVEAQITGNVWKIERAVGDSVAEEDVLLIIESMKMEIPVEAPCGGTISEIRVAEGDSIEEFDVLALIDE
jgi:acetyl-CoA carboxylase biotin carboxyl carrier protein